MNHEGENLATPASPITLDSATLASGRKGLTPAFGATLAEAMAVCLDDQKHSSPTSMNVLGSLPTTSTVHWKSPSDQAKRCWNDEQYTTEHGAYGIATLLVEQCGLEVVERSKKKTGFDFWLGSPGTTSTLFQGLSRMEVSGIRNGDKVAVAARVKQKVEQTKVSDGTLPAVIVVVEFGAPMARLEERCRK
jgi:hypothetical protein